MNSNREYKSRLDRADKSTIKDTSGRALILHGGKTLEHERLVNAGFNPYKIDSVEIKQAKHDEFISKADHAFRINAHRMNVHQFISQAPLNEYTYIHLDFNGHFVNSTNQSGILNTLSQLKDLLAKDTVARVRFTVSDSTVRNRKKDCYSRESEWTARLYEWYIRTFLYHHSPLPVAKGRSPSMLAYMCLAASLTLGVEDLEEFVAEPNRDAIRFGVGHRPIRIAAYESYCEMLNCVMHTCWFDVGKTMQTQLIFDELEAIGNYIIFGLDTFIRKEMVKSM